MSLSDRLDALAAMPPAQLRDEWQRVYRDAAPRLSPDLLRHGIAYRLQEHAFGGLSATYRAALKSEVQTRPSLMPGTELVRGWNGRSIRVRVVDQGYLFEDKSYRSLSAIARAVTGTAWCGPRFFGLTDVAG